MYLADVCQVLAAFVNLGLEDCELGFLSLTMPGYENDRPGKFGLQIAPQNLVGAAYAGYASVIAERQEIKECPGCGRMLFPESGRQKYCTKSCASTSRRHSVGTGGRSAKAPSRGLLRSPGQGKEGRVSPGPPRS